MAKSKTVVSRKNLIVGFPFGVRQPNFGLLRLCRLMCGKSLTFREACPQIFCGYFGRKGRSPEASWKSFTARQSHRRTSDGTAVVQISVVALFLSFVSLSLVGLKDKRKLLHNFALSLIREKVSRKFTLRAETRL
jgi:hypothetical protein